MPDFTMTGDNHAYNLDAEQSVLGAVLLDADNMARIADALKAEHFYVEIHREMFSAMLTMFLSGAHIDPVTLAEAVMRQKVFPTQDEARQYILRLMQTVPSASSVAHYVKIVEEKYLIRELMGAAGEIIDYARDNTQSPEGVLDFAEQRIYDIRSDKDIKGLTHIGAILVDKMNDIMKVAESGGKDTGNYRTGFSSIERYTHGLNPSDLILIAARPGMGKTSFALNLAVNVAKKHTDKKVAIFSLEMSKEQLASRMLSCESGVPHESFRTGKLARGDWKNIGGAAEILTGLGIYIDDSAAITVGQMKAKLRRMKNLGLVVIDYLQLMSSGRRIDNRVVEVSDMTRNLKIMSKELNIPVVTLSQLSRGPEGRQDKRPMLSDLRESGSIEQDADMVLFLYRPGYYDKTDPNQTSCECIIAKNRHGETATVELIWNGQLTRFTDPYYE